MLDRMSTIDADPSSRDAAAVGRLARTALLGSVAIMAAKLGAFHVTGSAAVLGDALESLVNIAAGALVVFSVWYATRPADREHPYGHGKIEFVTAGVEGVLIIVAGLAVVAESARRLFVGATVQSPGLGAALLVAIGIVLAALGWHIARRGQALDSVALAADGRHLLTDAVTTLAVAAALAVVKLTGWAWIDAAAACILCAWITWTGIVIIRRSLHGLLDRIDPEDDAIIRAILDEQVAAGRIASYEKVRHRHHGADHWVDMHLRFDPAMTVRRAHEIASAVEHRIEQELGRANATAHIEPESDDQKEPALGDGPAATIH
jgi:cation diffusion facilitator family transporter